MAQIIGSGGGKGGGGGGRTPTTEADSLDSRSYANVLDLISEGEIEGVKDDSLQNIFLNNTPIQNSDGSYNFTNVSYGFREGTSSQTIIGSGTDEPSFDITKSTVQAAESLPAEVTNNTGYWIKEHNFSLNQYIKKTISDVVHYFQCTTDGGSSGESEPSWNTTVGGTTSDGDLVWTCLASDPNTVGVVRTVSTSSASVNVIFVVIKIPALQHIEDDGDIVGTSVKIKIQLQITEGGVTSGWIDQIINPGGETDVDKKIDTITGRTGDEYKKQYSVDLPLSYAEAKIKVIRLTDNSSDLTRVQNQTYWDFFTKVTWGTRTYPDCALVGLRIDAEQFSSIPTRAYLVRGAKIRIPSIVVGGTEQVTVDQTTGAIIYPQNGVWAGTFQAAVWCADPAWCLWDLLTSQRYGLGDHVLTPSEQSSFDGNAERLSKFDFYAASKYCSALNTRSSGTTNDYHATTGKHGISDGFGGFEPRFSCNVYIQGRAEAFDLINSMAAVFMGMPYWSSGSLAVTQDKPQSSSYLFTLANITSEGFNYSGSSQRTRATVVVVKYFDQNLRSFAYERVLAEDEIINKYGSITKNIEAFACTSRSQAKRVAKWLLYTEENETEVVSFTCSLEAGVVVRPGQVIDIADPLKAGLRRGGRITASSTAQITVDGTAGVDTDLPQDTGSYSSGYVRTIHVLLPDGTVESRAVNNIQGNIIVPQQAFSVAPNVNSVWVLETSGGTSAENLQTTQWRVVSVEEEDALEYKVSALSYNASKYANVEAGETLTTRDFSNLNEIPAAPTGPLTVIQQLYKQADQVKAKIVFSWKTVLGVSKYEVRWRKANGSWRVYTQLGNNDEIPDITAGSFEFKIYSLNATGVPSSTALHAYYSATGKSTPPSDIANFAYSIDSSIGIVFTWDKLVAVYPSFNDLDVVGYEIRTTDANWGLSNNAYYNPTTPVAGENLIARVTANSYNLGFISLGSQGYYIKAYDSQDVYSTNSSSLNIAVGVPNTPSPSISFEGSNVVITWEQVSTVGKYAISHYEVSKDANFGTILEKLDTTVYKREVDFIGSQNFYVRAVDIGGNVSAGAIVSITNIAADEYGLEAAYSSGTSVDLNWNAKDGSTPTFSYELGHGPANQGTFADAVGKQQVKGTTLSFIVDWTTDRRFFIRAIDAQGNYGDAEHVDLSFATPGGVSSVTTTFKSDSDALLKSEIEISWNAATRGSLNIEEYEIRKNLGNTTSFAAATVIATIKALVITTEVDWEGVRKFWIVAKDINGNYGVPVSTTATVTHPGQVSKFSQEVIDNNVLLNWGDAASNLPILYYNIKKQTNPNLPLDTITNFGSRGSEIGTKQGLFTTVFETIGGTYTYWIAAVDSANNTGTPKSVSATVNQPPDYVLRTNLDSTFNNQSFAGGGSTTVSKTNAFAESDTLYVNVDTGRQYQEHFIGTGSSSSPQFPNWNSYEVAVGGQRAYGLPSATSGSYQEILDYGAVLAGTKAVGTMTAIHEAGSTTITPSISTSLTGPNDSPAASYSWTDYPGSVTTSGDNSYSTFGTNFRYIKFNYAFGSSGNDDLLKITGFNMRLEAKQKTDSGNGLVQTERTATYTQSGTEIVITQANHGYKLGDGIALNFTSGRSTDGQGFYKISNIQSTSIFKVNQYVSTGNVWTNISSANNTGNVTLDHGGGTVLPSIEFVDIAAIIVTPSGTSARIAIYDFLDAPNPKAFKVLLYNTSGTKVGDGTGTNFSWTARGN